MPRLFRRAHAFWLTSTITAFFSLWAWECGAAPFEDSMAQRTVACTVCHGDQGRAGPDGYYPRLAGKPAKYLYSQLLNFRDGRRHYALMTPLIDVLNDAYLWEIAQYFSALDLPYSKPPPSPTENSILVRGKTLATRGDADQGLPPCTQCHGTALTGVLPNVPGLLGLPLDYLNAQLGRWKNGQRHTPAPDCMADIARKLAPADLSAITHWLAAQEVVPHAKPALKPPARSANAPAIECAKAP